MLKNIIKNFKSVWNSVSVTFNQLIFHSDIRLGYSSISKWKNINNLRYFKTNKLFTELSRLNHKVPFVSLRCQIGRAPMCITDSKLNLTLITSSRTRDKSVGVTQLACLSNVVKCKRQLPSRNVTYKGRHCNTHQPTPNKARNSYKFYVSLDNTNYI